MQRARRGGGGSPKSRRWETRSTNQRRRAKGRRISWAEWGLLSHDGLWRGGEAFEVRFQAPKIRFSFTAPPPRSFQPPHNPRPAPTPPPLSVSLSLSLSFLIRRRPHHHLRRANARIAGNARKEENSH